MFANRLILYLNKFISRRIEFIILIYNMLKMKFLSKIFMLAFFFGSWLLVFPVTAQETTVVGQVLNQSDQTPIPNVNIFFKNSNSVVQSDENGYFLIRNNGRQNTIVFSAVGFQKKELHLKAGQSVGAQIKLIEDNTLLQEVFIVPGVNPALDLMKKVRLLRKENDFSHQTGYEAIETEQNLVLLNKLSEKGISKRVFDQLKTGNLAKSDSALVVPLYMDENKYLLTSNDKKTLSENVFNSPEYGKKFIESLVGQLDVNLNFYENSIVVFNKPLISPLANIGNAFYDYFLADSVKTDTGKRYEIHFRSKNQKNLAFNGKLWIDSATYALTDIETDLPLQANLNYIRNLHISQHFKILPTHRWTPQSESMALNMNYELLTDSFHLSPEIFVKRSARFQTSDSLSVASGHFAQSNFNATTLNEKLENLDKTPIALTAKWIATTILTGYMPAGLIDIGKIEQIIRITDIEGLRLTLPFRTSEKMWNNFSIGGFGGYGFTNHALQYSGIAQYKFKGNQRKIIGLNYTHDYRRVDYNYNDNLFRENPLITGDEDISSSVLAFKSVGKMSERRELTFTFLNDWNKNIETNFFLRNTRLLPNASMPLHIGNTSYSALNWQSITLSTRFSFNERKYDDFMQRIYITNNLPVFYATVEAGKYQLGSQSESYARIIGSVRQLFRFDLGQLMCIADAGLIFGNVPYPLLEVPPGSETGGYSTYQYNMMNYREYAADRYFNLHTELTLNGLIMNQIPLIKQLNLREIVSGHFAFGRLSDSHKKIVDFPTDMYPMNKPYVELGVGLTNILHLFTLQSVWRLTDLQHSHAIPWGLRGCLNITF